MTVKDDATPSTVSSLTAEDATLLKGGDKLRVVHADSFLRQNGYPDGSVVTFKALDRFYIEIAEMHAGNGFNQHRFTFIGRPSEDGWIPAPEGGWAENPVGDARVQLRYDFGSCSDAGGVVASEVVEGWWSRTIALRLASLSPAASEDIAEPNGAEGGEGLRDELDGWIVRGIQAADQTVTGIGPINACTPADVAAGRVSAYQVGFQNGVKSTLTDLCFIMARHPSQEQAPATPATEADGERERIARIIDPSLDCADPDTIHYRRVLAKTDAILAALPNQKPVDQHPRPKAGSEARAPGVLASSEREE